jgi:iron complex outermembrane receptor protein
MSVLKPLVVACAAALASLSAVAQTSDPSIADAKKLDTVVVTGTNLKGVDVAESQPVIVIDADDIQQTGAQTITDLLQQVSQRGGGTGNFSTATSGTKQEDSPAGSAGISLRGLGTSATLTLVNGRRIAASSFANGSENFVDINAIPLSAIDRIEVLTTGASAVYGADAVAGVVNVILRRDFDGLELHASYGDSTTGTDEARSNFNAVWGHQGERARALVVFDAYQRNALYDRDRSISAVEPRPSQQGIYPSFNDLDEMPFDLVERSCPDAQRFDGRPGFPRSRFGEYCELNRNAFTATDPESERYGAYGTFGWDFGDGLAYFSELALQQNTSQADSEPAPWSEEEVAFNHPNMPAELRTRLLAAGADPRFTIFGYGRFPDARSIEVETRNVRWINGLTGNLGDWSWEAAVNLSRSESEQIATGGIYNVERVRAGLLGELCGSGATNCRPGQGGIYYNPFGGQGNSAQVLDLLRERVPRDGTSELAGADLKFNGSWLSFNGNPLTWAIGAEFRREDIEDAPSLLATADPVTGDVPVYGFGSTAVQADRDQWALFSETLVPLAEGLDLKLAARYDYYSDFDGDFNPAASLRWQPSEGFLVRAGWNSSFRAPSLAQVGAGTTLSSGALPCSPGSEFFSTFCGGFAGDDAYLSEIYGNPDLEAESSKAWFVGTVIDFGESTSLSLDYWDFRHRNLVDIDPLELFRAALLDPSLVVRRGQLGAGQIGIETRNGRIGGAVDEVHVELINVGEQNTDGLDISLTHDIATSGWGDFRLYADATWTRSFERSESCGDDASEARRGAGPCRGGQRLVERAGEFRYPEWLADAGVRWDLADYTVRLWAKYVDSFYDDDQRDGVPAGRLVGSWTTFNASVTWDINDASRVSLAVRNLGDRDPPLALGSAANFDQFNHDSVGRFFTVGYTHRF